MELLFWGFFKSPDIATPAVNPVTAGKNIAKIRSRGISLLDGLKRISSG